MSAKATQTIVILWDSELRIAARAMKAMNDAIAAKSENVGPLADAAIRACWAALYHAAVADEGTPIVVAHHPAVMDEVVTAAPAESQGK